VRRFNKNGTPLSSKGYPITPWYLESLDTPHPEPLGQVPSVPAQIDPGDLRPSGNGGEPDDDDNEPDDPYDDDYDNPENFYSPSCRHTPCFNHRTPQPINNGRLTIGQQTLKNNHRRRMMSIRWKSWLIKSCGFKSPLMVLMLASTNVLSSAPSNLWMTCLVHSLSSTIHCACSLAAMDSTPTCSPPCNIYQVPLT
jgi:hypothetical protein